MSDSIDDHEEMDGSMVRPFMLTQGRTRSAAVEVSMESMVDRRRISEAQYHGLNPVQKQIFDHLAERASAAELSAHLSLPLGVIRVLVGDMAGMQLLEVHQTASTGDVQLVRRLIDGVRAL